MYRQPLRILSVILFPLVATLFGCAEESIEISDASTETGEGDDRPDGSGDNEGPTVEIMVDGATHAPVLRSAGELHVQAEAEDASGIEVVEFYFDGQLIASDTTEPYAARVMIPDASSNGERSLIARAFDSNGNMAQSTMPLSVALPEPGTVEWEYVGPGEGQRWVLIGAEDSALVVSSRSMLRISTEGTLISEYGFTYEVSAVTASEDGGVIAVGSLNGTLIIQQFTNEGVPLSLDTVDDFGAPSMSITQVALAPDNSLVISSVNPHPHYAGHTARISNVTLTDEARLEWHRYMMRQDQLAEVDRSTRVAVSPSGAIYTTPTFEAGEFDVYVQLRRLEHDGHAGPSFEQLVSHGCNYNDLVATEDGVFVAARLDDQAVIGRFGTDGEPDVLVYLGADAALVLEPAGDELVFASVMPGPERSTKLGRISMDGGERWSKQLGGGDVVQDIALTSVGHMYVVSEWEPDAWRLRRVHP